MIKKQFNTRAESVVLSYALILGILTVLSIALISVSASYLNTKQQSVTETQAEITAEAIASEVEEVDKIARKIDNPNSISGQVVLKSQTDDLIGQYPYSVTFKSHPKPRTYTLVITVITNDVDVTERTNVTLYEIDNVALNNASTGSQLVYKYTQNGTLTVSSETTIWAINTTGSFAIPSDRTFDGGIKTTGTISQGDNSIIYGPVKSTGGDVELGDSVTVVGLVKSPSDVQVRDDSIISGSINSGDVITLQQGTSVGGSVTADSNIQTGTNVIIYGDIASKNDILVGSQSTIESDVTGETITIYSNTVVNGTVDGTTVNLDDNVIVSGDVIVPDGSSLNCGLNVTINGQSCSNYRSANY